MIFPLLLLLLITNAIIITTTTNTTTNTNTNTNTNTASAAVATNTPPKPTTPLLPSLQIRMLLPQMLLTPLLLLLERELTEVHFARLDINCHVFWPLLLPPCGSFHDKVP